MKTEELSSIGLIAIMVVSVIGFMFLGLFHTEPTAKLVEPSSLTYLLGIMFFSIFAISLMFLRHKN